MPTIVRRRSPIFYFADQDIETMASDSNAYELLPSHPDIPLPIAIQRSPFLNRPRIIYSKILSLRRAKTALVFSVFLCVLLLYLSFRSRPESESSYPPLYEEYHKNELSMPQHNPDLPLPEGRHGKYLWMATHLNGGGLLLLFT